MKKLVLALFFICITSLPYHFAQAQQSPADQGEQRKLTPQEQAYVTALKNAIAVATRGPGNVPLLDEANLNLPQGDMFVPKAQAKSYLESMGNIVNEETLEGVILPQDDQGDWIITVNYIKAGYVRDQEAKEWNADDLFKKIKEGNDEANKERAKQGVAGLDIIGWVEPPKYDDKMHRLVWSMRARNQDATEKDDFIINYNTYALGRGGYFKLNLITPDKTIENNKIVAHTILSGLDYHPGKRYEDFNEKTDHVAAYGIAALVAGVAAKKLGLLAVIGVFFAKAAKIIAIAFFALMSKVKTIFRKLSGKDKIEPAQE